MLNDRVRVDDPQAVARVLNDFFINTVTNLNTEIPQLTKLQCPQVIRSERPVLLNGTQSIHEKEVDT